MRELYECHCHIALDGDNFKIAAERHRQKPDLELIRENLEKYRKAGASYIRDGGDKWGVSTLAAKIAEEYGIEYATPCFPIYKKGNYGGFIGKSYENLSDFRILVKEIKDNGGDFIKIMASGIMDFSCFGVLTGWELDCKEMSEMVNIAHGEGMPVMVHVNGESGVKACVEAGADSIEHGNYMDEDAVKCIADSGCLWVPTTAATFGLCGKGLFPEDMLMKILDMQKRNISLGASLGAAIATGSDGGAKCVLHGDGIIGEIEFLKKIVDEEKLNSAQAKLRHIFKHQV